MLMGGRNIKIAKQERSYKMETLHYEIGKRNKEYWALWKQLKVYGERQESKWNGDYWTETYKMDGKEYTIWENMELGIQSKIEIKEGK